MFFAVRPSVDLTIAISTLGSGINRIQLPKPVVGIRYLVLHQRPRQAPIALNRADVRVIALDTLGLSHSRNAALQHAETDLLVFSDDDTILFPNGIQALAHNLTMKPDLALAVGWRAERLPPRAQRADLTHFNCGRVCAPEFMVRRSLILNAGVLFDTDFGLGARFGVGEEYVFVTDALHKGLRGIILPVVTGSHPEKSTGDKWDSTTILADRRAVLYRVFGAWAPVVSALYALKHCRKFTSIKAIIHFLLPIK